MSTVSIGSNNELTGSTEYFRKIHQASCIGELLEDKRIGNYYEALIRISSRISVTLDEVYLDLQKNSAVMPYIEYTNRMNTIKFIYGMADICKMVNKSSGKADSCIDILSLRDYNTKPSSGASDYEINVAVSFVLNGGAEAGNINRSDRMDLVEKAIRDGEKYAAHDDIEKMHYLKALMNGKSTDFLKDIWNKLTYQSKPNDYIGKCGKTICSSDYIEHLKKHIFSMDYPNYYLQKGGDCAYVDTIRAELHNIKNTIQHDIEVAEQNNDYIEDHMAQEIKFVVDQLEQCGVECGNLKEKVDGRSWFVGGDPDQILQLQKGLNSLEIPGVEEKLLEDGVYGRKTLDTWDKFLLCFQEGTMPYFAYLDPLQTKHTGIGFQNISTELYIPEIGKTEMSIPSLIDYSPRTSASRNGITVFRVDSDSRLGYHINTVEGRSIKSGKFIPDSEFQRLNINNLNHIQISENAFNILKNFQGSAKVIRRGAQVLLVLDVVCDLYELGKVIAEDLQDADKKIGKKTYKAGAEIIGRWGGTIAGAKLGAEAGGILGTMALPGAGTVVGVFIGSMVGGVLGAFVGSNLLPAVVDITYVGE